MARVGLVLGAGGAVGHAFHAGVLATLHEALGWDARTADVVVGTSAGSMAGALLRAGFPPADLAARAMGTPLSAEGQRLAARAGLRTPPRPEAPRVTSPRPASAARLARAFWQPWKVRPGAVAAALLPEGSIPLDDLQAPFEALFGAAWPAQPFLVNAVDLDRGTRTVFGRAGAPPARVAEAVAASCAIPAYFAPVTVGDRRYVDGGVHSPTNADVLAGERLDLVVVCSPMSTTRGVRRLALDTPMRHAARLTLTGEVARLRATGTTVVVFAPSADDQEAMSGNPLDPALRAPVCRQVRVTTEHRLARRDVRDKLAALTAT